MQSTSDDDDMELEEPGQQPQDADTLQQDADPSSQQLLQQHQQLQLQQQPQDDDMNIIVPQQLLQQQLQQLQQQQLQLQQQPQDADMMTPQPSLFNPQPLFMHQPQPPLFTPEQNTVLDRGRELLGIAQQLRRELDSEIAKDNPDPSLTQELLDHLAVVNSELNQINRQLPPQEEVFDNLIARLARLENQRQQRNNNLMEFLQHILPHSSSDDDDDDDDDMPPLELEDPQPSRSFQIHFINGDNGDHYSGVFPEVTGTHLDILRHMIGSGNRPQILAGLLNNMEPVAVPLEKSLLNLIPIKEFNASHKFTNCSICLMDYEDGEKFRHLPCSHMFHPECIDKWLEQKPVCPVCKVDLRLKLKTCKTNKTT
jgi:hypothetical protein